MKGWQIVNCDIRTGVRPMVRLQLLLNISFFERLLLRISLSFLRIEALHDFRRWWRGLWSFFCWGLGSSACSGFGGTFCDDFRRFRQFRVRLLIRILKQLWRNLNLHLCDGIIKDMCICFLSLLDFLAELWQLVYLMEQGSLDLGGLTRHLLFINYKHAA